VALQLVTDQDIWQRICEGCRRKRLQLQMTQAELARRSGLSLRMIKKFEGGAAVTVRSLMKVYRALGELHRIEGLVPEALASPKEVFAQESKTKKVRQRAPRAKR
jgi:transcriptional regulator with XRE-family HTH domain